MRQVKQTNGRKIISKWFFHSKIKICHDLEQGCYATKVNKEIIIAWDSEKSQKN